MVNPLLLKTVVVVEIPYEMLTLRHNLYGRLTSAGDI